jgi:pyruvate dehydrogenase E2 component (dihydrolipoamide acetyltransferase)
MTGSLTVGLPLHAIIHRWRVPLSLSFDHRCVTGGEACRFLAAVIADLEKTE